MITTAANTISFGMNATVDSLTEVAACKIPMINPTTNSAISTGPAKTATILKA
jgi:hypothetical protein